MADVQQLIQNLEQLLRIDPTTNMMIYDVRPPIRRPSFFRILFKNIKESVLMFIFMYIFLKIVEVIHDNITTKDMNIYLRKYNGYLINIDTPVKSAAYYPFNTSAELDNGLYKISTNYGTGYLIMYNKLIEDKVVPIANIHIDSPKIQQRLAKGKSKIYIKYEIVRDYTVDEYPNDILLDLLQ